MAEMVVAKPVRSRNVASYFVLSSCVVRTLLDKQSFLEETLFGEAM